MQDWAIMVIAIVGITTAGSIITRALKQREREGGRDLEALEARIAALESLEARVQALETIATDPRTDLARQIGALEESAGG